MKHSFISPVSRGLAAVLSLSLFGLGALVLSSNASKVASAAASFQPSPVVVVEAHADGDRYPALDRLIARLAAEAEGRAPIAQATLRR